jgi:hypothetical protein
MLYILNLIIWQRKAMDISGTTNSRREGKSYAFDISASVGGGRSASRLGRTAPR